MFLDFLSINLYWLIIEQLLTQTLKYYAPNEFINDWSFNNRSIIPGPFIIKGK